MVSNVANDAVAGAVENNELDDKEVSQVAGTVPQMRAYRVAITGMVFDQTFAITA